MINYKKKNFSAFRYNLGDAATDYIKNCILKILLITSSISLLLFGSIVIVGASCEPGSSNGKWVLESQCSPEAWDNIYVTSKIDGNYKYEVDWCAAPCSTNCLGSCSDYGTSFPSSGVTPCYSESTKVYYWVCIQKEKNNGPPLCDL